MVAGADILSRCCNRLRLRKAADGRRSIVACGHVQMRPGPGALKVQGWGETLSTDDYDGMLARKDISATEVTPRRPFPALPQTSITYDLHYKPLPVASDMKGWIAITPASLDVWPGRRVGEVGRGRKAAFGHWERASPAEKIDSAHLLGGGLILTTRTTLPRLPGKTTAHSARSSSSCNPPLAQTASNTATRRPAARQP